MRKASRQHRYRKLPRRNRRLGFCGPQARSLPLCFLAACAHAPASTLTPVTPSPTLHGDFDGDGRADTAGFFENNEGVLLVVVHRAASSRPIEIWGGDISSFDRFTIRVAAPGSYTKACALYGHGCGDMSTPIDISLSHEGIIVIGVEDQSRTLYYWSDGEFKNVSVLLTD